MGLVCTRVKADAPMQLVAEIIVLQVRTAMRQAGLASDAELAARDVLPWAGLSASAGWLPIVEVTIAL